MDRSQQSPRIEEPIHILCGDGATGSLKQSGARDVVTLGDFLCPGPCDADSVRHLRKRRGYSATIAKGYSGPDAAQYTAQTVEWSKRFLSSKALGRKLVAAGKQRVVLWTTAAWTDLLNHWWTLSALKDSDVDLNRIWVADLPQHTEFIRQKIYPPLTLGYFSPGELKAAFGKVFPLDQPRLNAGAGLWQQFVSPSPLAFEEATRSGSAFFPYPRRVVESYGSFFPRLTNSSSATLRLSEVDQTLFDALGEEEWFSPFDMITVLSATFSQ